MPIYRVHFAGYFLLRRSNWQGRTELHAVTEVIATVLAVGLSQAALSAKDSLRIDRGGIVRDRNAAPSRKRIPKA